MSDPSGNEERFWQKVNRDGPLPPARPELGPCWLWTDAPDTNGYGRLYLGAKRKEGQAHRFAYELMVGPIPEGLELDHRCFVRLCVRPSHLEPVTHQENMLRVWARYVPSTHCRNGHFYDAASTYWRGDQRSCRECGRARVRAYRSRRRRHGSRTQQLDT